MSMAFWVLSDLCLPQGHKDAFASLFPWVLYFYETYAGLFSTASTVWTSYRDKLVVGTFITRELWWSVASLNDELWRPLEVQWSFVNRRWVQEWERGLQHALCVYFGWRCCLVNSSSNSLVTVYRVPLPWKPDLFEMPVLTLLFLNEWSFL